VHCFAFRVDLSGEISRIDDHVLSQKRSTKFHQYHNQQEDIDFYTDGYECSALSRDIHQAAEQRQGAV
jgi:hypothetical protein